MTTRYTEGVTPREGERKDYNWIAPFAILAVITLSLILYATTMSSAARTESSPSPESSFDSGTFSTEDVPGEVSFQWEKGQFDDLIGSTGWGYIIASTDDSLERVDPDTGDTIWTYRRPDATVCDIDESEGVVYAAFNPGGGCTDILALDAYTGEYEAQAQYGTNSDIAALTHGGGFVNVITPTLVRSLEESTLYPKITFGDDPAIHDKKGSDHKDCTISDAMTSEDNLIVGGKCNGDTYYSAYQISTEQEESYQGVVDHQYPLATTEPVTIPVVSNDHFMSVAQDNLSPAARVWNMSSQSEEESFSLQPGFVGYPYQYSDTFGYVWRVGDWVRFTPHDDLTTDAVDMRDAVSDPMIDGDKLFTVTYDGIRYADHTTGQQYDIRANIPVSSDYALSGKTFIALGNDGILRAYR